MAAGCVRAQADVASDGQIGKPISQFGNGSYDRIFPAVRINTGLILNTKKGYSFIIFVNVCRLGFRFEIRTLVNVSTTPNTKIELSPFGTSFSRCFLRMFTPILDMPGMLAMGSSASSFSL